MAGRLNAIVISPGGMSPKVPTGEKGAEDEKGKPEEGGSDEECRAAFDEFASAIDLPEDKRDAAYEAMHRYFDIEFMKAEQGPHEEAGEKEEGY
jgi:hypothetical protein